MKQIDLENYLTQRRSLIIRCKLTEFKCAAPGNFLPGAAFTAICLVKD
jgi:hypothetical protein